jgi:hypothetical protein
MLHSSPPCGTHAPNAAAAAYDWDGQGSGDNNNVHSLPSCLASPLIFLQVWNPGSGWVGNNDGEQFILVAFFSALVHRHAIDPPHFFPTLHYTGSTVHNHYDYRDA